MAKSLDEFKAFVADSIGTLQGFEKTDEVLLEIEARICQLTGCDKSILLFRKDQSTYYSPLHGIKRTFEHDINSLFSEAIRSKQPLLVNDAPQSLLLNDSIDILEANAPIKDLFFVPLAHDKHTQTPPEILAWGALFEGNSDSITQKKILYLMKFLHALRHYLLDLFHTNNQNKTSSLEQCLEQNTLYEKTIEHHKRYFNSIIHDIRTPMNALIGFLELLLANENDQSKIDYLSSALKSGEHMVRLINDALDIAKIESGELPVEKHPFNIHEELADTIQIFFETAHKKKVLLCAYLDPSLPDQIVSDAYRIKQVLSNLISNAVKFTPEGGEILIEVLYDHGNDTVTFSVSDTGKGIAPEALETIFIPYKQENSQTEREYGGTGLGLSISHQIVTMLGGTLNVKSTLGKGSTFYFILPALSKKGSSLCKIDNHIGTLHLYRWEDRNDLRAVVLKRYLQTCDLNINLLPKSLDLQALLQKGIKNRDILIIEKTYFDTDQTDILQTILNQGVQVIWLEDVFDAKSTQFQGNIRRVTFPILAKPLYEALYGTKTVHDQLPTLHPKNLSSKRVAVIDDNRINLKFMEAILSKYGIETYAFDDAQTALQTLCKDPFDLVFIDEQMPHMEGSTAIRHLRTAIKEGKIPPLHIVSLSGDSAKEHEILEAGADMFLTKPIHIESLEQALYRYLNT